VLQTDAKVMANMRNKTDYYVDVPRITIDQVESKKMFSINTLNIPPGSQFVALCWVWEDHVFHKPSSFKPLSPRFHFPPNAANVTVSFEGEPGLIFAHGFENLGTETASRSLTSIEYFRKLIHRKWYGKSFHSLFPGDAKRSRDGILIFDLTAHKIKKNTNLNVHVKYDDKQGMPGYYLASFIVQQFLYTYRHGRELECKVVV